MSGSVIGFMVFAPDGGVKLTIGLTTHAPQSQRIRDGRDGTQLISNTVFFDDLESQVPAHAAQADDAELLFFRLVVFLLMHVSLIALGH